MDSHPQIGIIYPKEKESTFCYRYKKYKWTKSYVPRTLTTIMKTFSMIILLTFVFSMSLIGQSEMFEFDKKIASKYAITAMEEYEAHNSNIQRNFKQDYKISNPLFYSRYLEDCDGINQKVVLVSFEQQDGNGSASIYMVFSKDDYFERFLDRHYSTHSAKDEIKGFKEHDYDLFGCDF